MSNRPKIFLIGLALACVSPVAAQSAASSPSMNPNGLAAPAKNELFSSDRPKGAQTEITAQTAATFDNAASKAVFTGKVVVKDPQFTLYCEELVVYLNENRKGLKIVEAIGKVVVVQENKDEKGEPMKSIGRGGKALFNPATGDITLTESPQIQQGINNHVSVSPATIMVLNRAGRLSTTGSSKTVIVDANEGALAQ